MYVAIVNLREKCAGNYKAFRIGRDFWHAAISGPVPGVNGKATSALPGAIHLPASAYPL